MGHHFVPKLYIYRYMFIPCKYGTNHAKIMQTDFGQSWKTKEHPLGMKVLAGFIDTSPYQVLKFKGKLLNITTMWGPLLR
jgi:hypothetical protein